MFEGAAILGFFLSEVEHVRGAGMTTSYDRVRYPNWPVARSHPGHVGAMTRLMGREIVPFSRSRVLEIACGEGINIANMAVGAPGARFVGIDLAPSSIERGSAVVAKAGLSNVALNVADIRDESATVGDFDYIIAHGVYSWVPDDARQAIMTMIGRKLSANGVAFLSYNAFPGCRARETIRDFLRFALRGVEDPAERMDMARAALDYQISGWSEDEPLQKALRDAAKDNLRRPIEVLFHDEMSEFWRPQFLHDVVAAARGQGLDYLADAHPQGLQDGLFPSERFEAARPHTGGDWAAFEQWLDFTDLRAFRWSLFCRAGAPIDRLARPERVAGLYACADLTAAPGEGKMDFAFRGKNGVEFETGDARLGGLLERLSRGEAVLLDEFIDAPGVVEAVLKLTVNSALSLSTEPPLFSRVAGEKPLASPLARAQAALGENVLAALHHKPVRMEDPFWQKFLPQIDGAHTHEDLARFVVTAGGRTIEEARRMISGALAEVVGNRLMME